VYLIILSFSRTTTAFAAPISSIYNCTQGHEQEAAEKLQAFALQALKNFFGKRNIEVNSNTLQSRDQRSDTDWFRQHRFSHLLAQDPAGSSQINLQQLPCYERADVTTRDMEIAPLLALAEHNWHVRSGVRSFEKRTRRLGLGISADDPNTTLESR
jgi:hypothetical protein